MPQLRRGVEATVPWCPRCLQELRPAIAAPREVALRFRSGAPCIPQYPVPVYKCERCGHEQLRTNGHS